jgi:predicted Zn finger-like uncharacterized protein
MILTCPNCGTQYVVKDDAIPPEGRQVRCAACKHSWHQDPNAADVEETPPLALQEGAEPQSAPASPGADDVERPAEDQGLAEATAFEPRSGPEVEERAYEEAVIEGETDIPDAEEASVEPAESQTAAPRESESAAPTAEDWNEPPHAEPAPDMFSPFAENGEAEPKRRRPLMAIMIVALIVILAAAAFWFFAPLPLKAKLGLSAAGATPLSLVTTHMDLQQLESGNQLLTVTGRVINPTTTEQVVPPLQAQLLGRGGKVVYSWTIDPPARTLPAGASASFNSAEVNVPPGGSDLRITLGQPKA